MTLFGRFAKQLSAAVLGLGVVLAPAPSSAQPVTLTPTEMRQGAANAVLAGNPALGLAMADALLQRDPNDIDALLIRARALRDLGAYKTSTRAARAAWAAAPNPQTRYAASMAMAQALSSDGKRTRAQLWLRRAGQLAPNDGLKARAIEDFRFVRSRNPLSVNLSFNIAPTSNVNGGSSSDTFESPLFPGLPLSVPGRDQALSGTQYSAGVTLGYRLQQTQAAQTFARASLNHTTYTLSDSAKKKAPGAEGNDYAQSRLSVGLTHDIRFAGSPFGLGLQAQVTEYWYSGDELTRNHLLAGTGRLFIAQDQYAQLRLGYDWREGFNGRADQDMSTADLAYVKLLPKGKLTLTLGATASASSDIRYDYSERRIGLRYAPAKPLGQIRFDFGVTASRQDYDSNIYTRLPRTDDRLSADVTMTFQNLEYFGFVPSMTLRASRRDSNVAVYDSDSRGVYMGFRSSF